jgi:Polysaccharide pyruvyl transferase
MTDYIDFGDRDQARDGSLDAFHMVSPMSDPSVPRVAIAGTFDLENFGDLLFPLLAKRELEARLGHVELVPYSFRPMGQSEWPYEVKPLGELSGDLTSCDALLVGGGHLVRFAGELAPGYGPTDAQVHSPTGIWLEPTLLALSSGVPVVWNGIGVEGLIPSWAAALVRSLLKDVAYAAIRDPYSAELLLDAAPDAELRLMPDTAFGVASMGEPQLSEARGELITGLDKRRRRYVLVQASPHLSGFRVEIERLLDAAAKRGLGAAEVTISPVLGDRLGVLDLSHETTAVDPWPDPSALLDLIAHAEAVIAQSLHMSIVASAFGVPVYRPASEATEKYVVLDGLEGVHLLSEHQSEFELGRRRAGRDVQELAAQVAAHWDRVVDVVRSGSPDARRPSPRFVVELSPAVAQIARVAALEDELRRAQYAKELAQEQVALLEQEQVALLERHARSPVTKLVERLLGRRGRSPNGSSSGSSSSVRAWGRSSRR